MPALVVYDSAYGNTAQVARDIAAALPHGEAHAIGEIDPRRLPPCDLLIVGSPTQGGQPTAALRTWLGGLPPDALENTRCAAFDTRLAAADQGFALRLLMQAIGYAAPRIAKRLLATRGILAAEPVGFLVDGKEGPLRAGERERAARWAKALTPAPVR